MPSSIAPFTYAFVRNTLSSITEPNVYYTHRELIDLVVAEYCNMGGSVDDINIDTFDAVRKGLKTLKSMGTANTVDLGVWVFTNAEKNISHNIKSDVNISPNKKSDVKISPNKVIGDGRESVYAWRLPLEEVGELFSMKIGKTVGDPIVRMKQYVKTMEISHLIPGLPILELVIKCDNCSALEKYIHTILTLKGRHIDSNSGNEWFRTNVEELVSIHEDLLDKM